MSTTTAVASTQVQPVSSKSTKRNELETLIKELQSKLGKNWDKYHENLSLFLIGKLSRPEFLDRIVPLLKNGAVNYHNRLLLLNFANSFKDGPIDFANEFATFWNKKAKSKTVRSSQYEKFKQNIMGLPIRERRRIKNITRESGKRNKLSAGITLTRHALLPKIPSIQDKEQQQLQVNNLVQWQKDVVNGINTPFNTDNFELPDFENLSKRVIMTMREHGLTGDINQRVLEIIILGLEIHLKNIIESSIDVGRYREKTYTSNDYLSTAIQSVKAPPGDAKDNKNDDDENDPKRRKVVLNIDDLCHTLEMFPYLTEPNGARARAESLLKNDDDITDELEFELPPKPLAIEPVISVGNGSLKDEKPQTNAESGDSQKKPVENAHVGTTDELKWVLHDLYKKM